MRTTLSDVRFIGAQALIDGDLRDAPIAVADGRIAGSARRDVDLGGYMLLPGIVDLHGDAYERHLAPRRTAPFSFDIGLTSTERDAASHGVTTAWMAVSWSWEGGRRGPDFAEQLLEAHRRLQSSFGTDLRIQIRCETHLVDSGPRLLAAVERYGIDYVVFNDHLNEAMEAARARPAEVAAQVKGEGRSFEAHMALLNAAMERRSEVPRHLCRLAEAFDRLGVTYGSHDDPDGETRQTYAMLGARIAEFPTRRRAAAAAKAMDNPVLMGAPNVVRGGSQSGNIAAQDLVVEDLCDALVSDYYYPALPHAAWTLADAGLRSLPEAWAMISERPAGILGLADRGRLVEGQRADLVAVNAETRAIELTMAGGVITYVSAEAACRLAQGSAALDIAAE